MSRFLSLPRPSVVRHFATGTLLTTSAILAGGGSAFANPEGGTVVHGDGRIEQDGKRTDVFQYTGKIIIDWRSFSIDADEITEFHQPSSTAMALNRVTGSDPSRILGQLKANGRVVLINPNGIFFGPGSRVDVAGLIATTTDIRNEDFLADRFEFSRPSEVEGVMVINEGTITIEEGGFAYLVAPGVRNSGVIKARLGHVELAAGQAFSIDLYGDQLLNFTLGTDQAPIERDGSKAEALVTNDGVILADGGSVALTASSVREVVEHAFNVDGVIRANAIKTEGGRVTLFAEGPGGAHVSGTISASGEEKGQSGGEITIAADAVSLEGATLDASGQAGGGRIVIGAPLPTPKPEAPDGPTMTPEDPPPPPRAKPEVIEIDQGSALLAQGGSEAGGSIALSAAGSLTVDGRLDARGADQEGAPSGSISASADGDIRGSGTRMAAGHITLAADADQQPAPEAPAAGTGGGATASGGTLALTDAILEAVSRGPDSAGGHIELTGDFVGLFGDSLVDASGATGGGTLLIGGDYQGGGATRTARRTYISAGTALRADALDRGAGGKIIVWADEVNRYHGALSARGGALGGAGGLAEISGKETLVFRGQADLTAADGSSATGTLLLDPRDIVISNSGGSDPATALVDDNLDQTVAFGEAGGDGTDVTITANGAGSLSELLKTSAVVLQANRDITVDDAIDGTNGASGHDLTLQAGRSLIVDADIAVDGGVTLVANEDALSAPAERGTSTATLAIGSGVTIDTTSDGGDITLIMDNDAVSRPTANIAIADGVNLLSGNTIVINHDATVAATSPVLFGGTITMTGASLQITTQAADVEFSSDQDFSSLGSVVIDTSNSGNDVSFLGKVDGATDVTVDAGSGTVTVGDTIGGTTAVNSFSVTNGGQVDLNASLTAQNNISLQTSTLNQSAGTSLTTHTGGTEQITLKADSYAMGGAITSESVVFDTFSSTHLDVGDSDNGNTWVSSGTLTNTDASTVSFGNGNAVNISVDLASNPLDAATNLHFNSADSIAVDGAITTGTGTVTMTAGNGLDVDAAIQTNGGDIDLTAVNSVSIREALASGSGDITIDSGASLSHDVAASYTTAGGDVNLKADANFIHTGNLIDTTNGGTVAAGGNITLMAASTTGGGAITGAMLDAGTGGTIAVIGDGTVVGAAGGMALDSSFYTSPAAGFVLGGSTTTNVEIDTGGNVLDASLTTQGTGTTTLVGDIVTDSKAVAIDTQVLDLDGHSIDTTAGGLSTGADVSLSLEDGSSGGLTSLTLDAGDIDVGSTGAISLTVNGAGKSVGVGNGTAGNTIQLTDAFFLSGTGNVALATEAGAGATVAVGFGGGTVLNQALSLAADGDLIVSGDIVTDGKEVDLASTNGMLRQNGGTTIDTTNSGAAADGEDISLSGRTDLDLLGTLKAGTSGTVSVGISDASKTVGVGDGPTIGAQDVIFDETNLFNKPGNSAGGWYVWSTGDMTVDLMAATSLGSTGLISWGTLTINSSIDSAGDTMVIKAADLDQTAGTLSTSGGDLLLRGDDMTGLLTNGIDMTSGGNRQIAPMDDSASMAIDGDDVTLNGTDHVDFTSDKFLGTPAATKFGGPKYEGDITIQGPSTLGQDAYVETTAAGKIILAADVNGSGHDLTLQGAVQVDGSHNIAMGGGNITFEGTIDGTTDGTDSLAVSGADALTLQGAVGSLTPLKDFSLQGSQIALDGGSITTNDGDVSLSGTSSLGTNLTVATGGGDVSINGSLSGPTYGLALNAGAGTVDAQQLSGNSHASVLDVGSLTVNASAAYMSGMVAGHSGETAAAFAMMPVSDQHLLNGYRRDGLCIGPGCLPEPPGAIAPPLPPDPPPGPSLPPAPDIGNGPGDIGGTGPVASLPEVELTLPSDDLDSLMPQMESQGMSGLMQEILALLGDAVPSAGQVPTAPYSQSTVLIQDLLTYEPHGDVEENGPQKISDPNQENIIGAAFGTFQY